MAMTKELTEDTEIEFFSLESEFELCDAREEAEIEIVLSHIFLANYTQQYLGRNQLEN